MEAGELKEKKMSELRTLAKKLGIISKSGWKREDYMRAIARVKTPSKAKKTVKKTFHKASKKTAAITPMKGVKKVTGKVSVKGAKKIVRKVTAKTVKAAKKTAVKATRKTAKKVAPKNPKKMAKTVGEEQVRKVTQKTAEMLPSPLAPKKTSAVKGRRKKISQPFERKRRISAKTSPEIGETVPVSGKRPVESVSAGTLKIPRVARARQEGTAPPSSKVTLMVIDPYRLFVYWDIAEYHVDEIVRDGEGYYTLVRVSFFKDKEQTGFFDVIVDELSDKKYIEVVPDRGYQVEFGVIKGEKYFPIARSRMKYTPTFKIAEGEVSPREGEVTSREGKVTPRGGDVTPKKGEVLPRKADLFTTQIPHPRTRISS
jgi:hypothetical protein